MTDTFSIPKCALLVSACLLLVLAGSEGAESSAAKDLAACRKLVAQKKWQAAVEGFEKLFEDHRGDPVVIRAIRDVEDDYKRALFMVEYGEPSGKDLFGPQVRYWGKGSLKIDLVCGSTLTGPVWETLSDDIQLLRIRFRDKVTVEMGTGSGRLLLCYDLEKEGGYLVQLPGFVLRLDQDERAVIARPDKKKLRSASGDFKIVRDAHSIKVYRGGTQVSRVSDKTYRGGYLAFVGRVNGLRIVGCLDKAFYHQLVGSREDAAFREWQDKSYDRDKVIPRWAREGAPESEGHSLAELPSDATKGFEEDVGGHIERALEGEEESVRALEKLAKSQFGERTRTYLEAIAAFCNGEREEARKKLSAVLEKEPGFGPALALRGILLMGLRRIDEARADLEAARKASPKLHWAYLGQVYIAIYEGDLDAAAKVIADANEAGAVSPEVVRMGKMVHRARRGPLWSTRFEYSSKNFEIASDHSKDLCKDTAHLLEVALTAYSRHFLKVQMPKRKARVLVFGSRQSYLGYALDLRRDLRFTAGAYDPNMRELVLFLPVVRTGFNGTVRHEGFHRFLHVFLDDCPLWFNEGCAEFYGSSEEIFGGIKPGAVDREAVKLLKAKVRELPRLSELFTMGRREFMENAHLHYPQSWAVVHYLMTTKERDLNSVLMDYFESLRAGRSGLEAYEEHLKPKVRKIEAGYLEHLLKM
jgi:tetratricopeptide (TPR) repeat protein